MATKHQNHREKPAGPRLSFRLFLILGFSGSLLLTGAILSAGVFAFSDPSAHQLFWKLMRAVYPWPYLVDHIAGLPDLVLLSLMGVQFFLYALLFRLGRHFRLPTGLMLGAILMIHVVGLLPFFGKGPRYRGSFDSPALLTPSN